MGISDKAEKLTKRAVDVVAKSGVPKQIKDRRDTMESRMKKIEKEAGWKPKNPVKQNKDRGVD